MADAAAPFNISQSKATHAEPSKIRERREINPSGPILISTHDFSAEVNAPRGSPIILLIMPDDVGFGAATAFGGPIPTPALDRVSEACIRYNQFYMLSTPYIVVVRILRKLAISPTDQQE